MVTLGERSLRDLASFRTSLREHDVRLAAAGRAPVHFIGDMTLDGSGFGISPDYDVERLRDRIRAAFAACHSEVS